MQTINKMGGKEEVEKTYAIIPMTGTLEDALREYRTVSDSLGVLDPVLDKHIEKAYIANLRSMVEKLQASPEDYDDPEGQIAALEKDIYDYHWKCSISGGVSQTQSDFSEIMTREACL